MAMIPVPDLYCMPGWQMMWLDPGKTTGIATYNSAGQFRSEQAGFMDTGHLISFFTGNRLMIGWERFDITAVTHRLPGAGIALEVIGMARYLAIRQGAEVLTPSPRSARSACPPDLLKAMGWYRKAAPHANDAARHLAAHCVTRGMLAKPDHEKLVSWNESQETALALRGTAGRRPH